MLRPRIDGDIPFIETNSVQTIKITNNLELLRGDVSLSSIEDALAEAHVQRFSNKTHEKRTYVAIGDLLNRYGEANDIDYILIDVGPSSGALTRACFLACDGFFVPTAPDRFNVQAIGTLSLIIKRWMDEHRQIYQNFLDLDLPIKTGLPKFLGVILQNYKIRGGKPKPSYQMWIDRIPAKCENALLPVLSSFSTDEYDMTSGLYGNKIVATSIRDFESLSPLMQECGKPIFSLTSDDTRVMNPKNKPWSGNLWAGTVVRMEEYKKCISELSERLELIQ